MIRPQHIKELQLKIWLFKSPVERLKQFMDDNAFLFQILKDESKTNKALEFFFTRGISDDLMAVVHNVLLTNENYK
jgi:hypothetical protein